MATVNRERRLSPEAITEALSASGYSAETGREFQCSGNWDLRVNLECESRDAFRIKFVSQPLRQLGIALEEIEASKAQSRRTSNVAFDELFDLGKSIWDQLTDRVEPEPIDTIRVGAATYVLRGALLAHVARDNEHSWNYRVDRFPPDFVGDGLTIADARRDWRTQVHTRFQQLVRSRPFRMSEEEKADWAILSELIDVEHYWKTTPFRHHETGCVSVVSSGVWEITWLGVDGTESIGAERVPDEFAGYQKDQWFEALVERDRDSFALQKIIDSRAIDPIEDMTDEEVEAWYSSLPTTETLPKSDTDWNTL